MTVEVQRDALVGAIRSVIDVVSSKATIPVLANLLLKTEVGQLTITGTDLNVQAASTIEAAGDMDVTVDAQKLLAAAISFKPGTLTIAPVAGRSAVLIKQGRGQRTLQTLSSTDFPKREPLSGTQAFTLPSSTLSRLFDVAGIAQSTDEIRYYLNGIFLHVSDLKLVAVATDGHRLIRVNTALPEGIESMVDTIVPRHVVGHLRKLLAKYDGEVAIEVNSKAISFALGRTHVVANVVVGTFPDDNRVIPPVGSHSLVAVRDAFIEPVASVSGVVNAEGEKIKARCVRFDLGMNGEHEVSAQDQTGTKASEPLDVEVRGGAFTFGVNEAYFRAIVGVFAETAAVTIASADPAAPLLLTSDKDPDITAVIMPMRV